MIKVLSCNYRRDLFPDEMEDAEYVLGDPTMLSKIPQNGVNKIQESFGNLNLLSSKVSDHLLVRMEVGVPAHCVTDEDYLPIWLKCVQRLKKR